MWGHKPTKALSVCLLLFAALFFLPCFAQTEKIDSLKLALTSARGAQKIDYLNRLSSYYISAEIKDSAVTYANKAFQEATRVNDSHGIAKSLLHQSQLVKHFDNDFAKAESLAKASLTWYDRSKNKEDIDQVFRLLVSALAAQSRYEEALFYSEKNYHWAKQSNNLFNVLTALQWSLQIYFQNGDYEKCFPLAQQSHDLSLQTGNKQKLYYTFIILAKLYMVIEDYVSAINYYRQAFQMEDDSIRSYSVQIGSDIWIKMQFAESFAHLRRFDSAWHYYRLFKPPAEKPVHLRIYRVSTGLCHFLQKEYSQALKNFQLGLAEHRKLNDRNEVMRTLLYIGQTYLALGKNEEALLYGREGLQLAMQTKAKHSIRDGYEILTNVYDRLGTPDSANLYFRHYATLKESVISAQTRGKLAAYKYEQRLEFMNKEKEVQQAKIEQETFIKNLLIGGITLLLLLSALLLRNSWLRRKNEKQKLEHQLEVQRLESEKTKASLQQQATELEMQALRAQMNPHFIFNSLNSINHFILQNNKQEASEYLTKFSRLTRLILQNSQAELVTLQTEIESLELYLQLEALRFDHHFAYSISLPEKTNIAGIKLPPLILQPYVENAIWHGLMPKAEKGLLTIKFLEKQPWLYCKISDNGVGRKQADKRKQLSSSTHKSMGLEITAHRLANMQGAMGKPSVTINDLVEPDGTPAGTEVILKLPLLYAQSNLDRR